MANILLLEPGSNATFDASLWGAVFPSGPCPASSHGYRLYRLAITVARARRDCPATCPDSLQKSIAE